MGNGLEVGCDMEVFQFLNVNLGICFGDILLKYKLTNSLRVTANFSDVSSQCCSLHRKFEKYRS